MRQLTLSFLLLIITQLSLSARETTVTLRILETTDVHGAFFPYDFIQRRPMPGTLARVASYVGKARQESPDGVILLDAGDILQGQPICYFYNYIDTTAQNIASRCVNYLRYDAQTWGNHDVETGHACYDKWNAEVSCPTLGANIIDTRSNRPYIQPYTVIERQGVRVAVIGLLTPAIPNWLPEQKWQHLRFDEMKTAARKWIDEVRRKEKPDVIVGLFHSGLRGGITTEAYAENAAEAIARDVPGFDIVMFGHDHQAYCQTVKNAEGREVTLLDAATGARRIAEATVTLTKRGKKVVDKKVEGRLIDLNGTGIDTAFMAHFAPDIEKVKAWAARRVGQTLATLSTRDAYFGPSAFIDLIHGLQLEITGAQISITSPLTFDTTLPKGDITVADLFKLYKYENGLYVMRLTGRELRGHLEMAYAQWTRQMRSVSEHILNIDTTSARPRFRFPSYDFDSAAGIEYTVDVTKPQGQRLTITQLSDGTPFDDNATYTVAMNSYRGNGGGELLTRGAGIAKDSLESRIVTRYDRDLRHYLMREIERLGIVDPKPMGNWRFVPDDLVAPALARDRELMFGR